MMLTCFGSPDHPITGSPDHPILDGKATKMIIHSGNRKLETRLRCLLAESRRPRADDCLYPIPRCEGKSFKNPKVLKILTSFGSLDHPITGSPDHPNLDGKVIMIVNVFDAVLADDRRPMADGPPQGKALKIIINSGNRKLETRLRCLLADDRRPIAEDGLGLPLADWSLATSH
jgi:hypothetical protein